MAALAVCATALAACGGRTGPDGPQPARGGAFADPLEIYSDLGFLTGPTQFPVVASLSTLAGPADSTLVILALSIPNSALRFQREETGFFAEYDVSIEFMTHDSVTLRRGRRRELVRVPAFDETARSDESVVHQQSFVVQPGSYLVRMAASDAHSSRGFRTIDTLAVPAFGAGGRPISEPLLVYEGTGRTDRGSMPALIANPRHTVPYGGADPRVYVESYTSLSEPVSVQVRAADESVVWSGDVAWSGVPELQHALVDIPADVLPLGRLTVTLNTTETESSTQLVMTISDQWMVANFDEVLQFMRFITTAAELDSLRAGSAADRRRAWESFWSARDPLPVTAINEFRETFFERVRYAAEAFREMAGRAGWNTDRGEVYIVLGVPDRVQEGMIGASDHSMGQPNAEEWTYYDVAGQRLNLLFHDRTGFGRFELVPASASAFGAAADRLKRARPGAPRGR